jgi:hypothetical protein
VFENVTRDARAIGDGAYLFDPDGDLRSWMLYPCRIDCSDPLEGAVDVTARPRGTESVDVTNRSQAAFDLQGYVLSSPPWSYAFPAGSVVQPGQTLRILTGGDPAADEPLRKHWGMLDPILDNGGDVVRVKTYTDLQLACHAWGGKSC